MPTPRGSKQRAVQPPRPLPQKRPADPDLDATFAQDTASSSSASSSPANGKRRAAQPAPPYHSEYDYDATAFAQHTATSSRPSRAAAPLPVGESSRDEQLLDLVMRKVDAKNAQLIDQLSKTSAAQQRVAQQLQAQLASRGTVPHQEAVHAAPAAEPTPVQAPPPSTYLHDFIAILKTKLSRTVEQSDFQASIVAKCDIYGHRFAEHAKTALISAYNGDYTHSSDALADAAKACRQDDKSGSSGYRDYRAPPPMPSRARNNDRTFISSQSHKLPPP